jgi:hypothetical protein
MSAAMDTAGALASAAAFLDGVAVHTAGAMKSAKRCRCREFRCMPLPQAHSTRTRARPSTSIVRGGEASLVDTVDAAVARQRRKRIAAPCAFYA